MKQTLSLKIGLAFCLVCLGMQSHGKKNWEYDLGVIHPAMPKTKLLSATESLFEIKETALVGEEVIGRINLANNSFEKATFEITGGTGINHFSVEKIVNSRGKHFGVLRVSKLPLEASTYTVQVKTTFESGETDEQEYLIRKVKATIAERFYQFVYSKLSRSHRLYFPETDTKLAEHLLTFTPEGYFSDLTYGLSKAGWEGLNAGALRINNLAMGYLDPNSVYYRDEDLKQKVYSAIIFNAGEFARYRTQWYETHLWRNTDYMAGIAIHYFQLLRQEMNDPDREVARRSMEVYDALIDNCDNLFAERMNERPAIGNANRNHRIRSLAVRAAISFDYNRALTDWDLWYDPIDPRIPGSYPTGAINDLMELVETSFVFSDTYQNKNGFFPDGTICHHPAVGIQFTADAYGWEWLTEWSIPLANNLKNTIYQAQDATYDIITERILDAYRLLTYNGYLDMSVGGIIKDRSKWGRNLLGAVNGLLSGKSENTLIQREDELLGYKERLENPGYADALSMSKAFWNIDYLIQRRPGYFVSAKMISTRSRGLERGLENRSYYYLGDGALFVRVHSDAFNNLQNYYNWHSIPGTTAEQRNDALPPNADSPYIGANGTNEYAGVVSNGFIGMGAFKYERNHAKQSALYSTVNANKGYFFFDRELVALGNSIRRVRAGDQAEIWTTLNQLEWTGDITYGSAEEENVQIISVSDDNVSQFFSNIRKPMWFHHDQVGYVIIPSQNQPATIGLTAESRDYQFPYQANKLKKMMQLEISHGINPSAETYQYVVLPNTSIEYTKQFAQTLGGSENSLQILSNDESVMAVYNRAMNVVQVAFYEAGDFEYTNAVGEMVRMTVDRPALVMMSDKGQSLDVTVTDPHHSMHDLTINLKVNIKLKGEYCDYDETNQQSVIAITHSPEEVYAGQPVSATFQKEGVFVTDTLAVLNEKAIQVIYDRKRKRIRVNFDGSNGDYEVFLYNISGMLLSKKVIKGDMPGRNVLDVFSTEGLSHGLYLVSVKGPDINGCKKLIIDNV